MILKGLIDEDFVNYHTPSMVLFFPNCTFKCEKDCGERVCQNGTLAKSPDIETNIHQICIRYLVNTVTHAIVCGGLEPMDSFDDLYSFIKTLRYEYKCEDDVVIYSGYTLDECNEQGWIKKLAVFDNIIVKFGRYIPNQDGCYDKVLGVNLASNNQYAMRL